MGLLTDFRYRKISQSVTVNALLKEFFRKGIHLCASLVPFLAALNFSVTIAALSSILCFYIVCESRRLNGNAVPFVSRVTSYAARKRDNGRFVLGPVTMALGILFTLLIFPHQAATIGIFALAFGDGVASLAGTLWGRTKILYMQGKTVEGSFACFAAVFLATVLVTQNPLESLFISAFAVAIEVLPVRDYDNLMIPLLISASVVLLP